MVYSRVTAEGLYALAELPAGPQLRWLSLAGSCQFLPLRGRDRWTCYRDGPLVPEWEVDPDHPDQVEGTVRRSGARRPHDRLGRRRHR